MVDATKVPYVCWHVTYRCNLRCSFCYAPKEGHEPDREEFLAVGDALAAGCERISLMGGEPLLNPHVPEVAARLHGRCGLSLVTNGTLLTPELVTALAPRLDRMSVSLDAVSQEVATACRGPRYDMRRVTEGVRLVVRAGLPLKVNTLVTVRNAGHIAEILRFLVSLGAPVDWKLAEPGDGFHGRPRDRAAPRAADGVPGLRAVHRRRRAGGGNGQDGVVRRHRRLCPRDAGGRHIHAVAQRLPPDRERAAREAAGHARQVGVGSVRQRGDVPREAGPQVRAGDAIRERGRAASETVTRRPRQREGGTPLEQQRVRNPSEREQSQRFPDIANDGGGDRVADTEILKFLDGVGGAAA